MSDTEQEQVEQPDEGVGTPLPPNEDDTTEAPDEDEDAPQAPDEEPGEAQETQALLEERSKKLDQLKKHVAKRLGEILGDDAPYYVECELCSWSNTPGMRPPFQPPPDVLSQLFMLLGQKDPAEIKHDPHSQTCSECAGEGVTATGSKVQGQTELPCVNCKGLGWMPTDDARRSPSLSQKNGLTVNTQTGEVLDATIAPAVTPLPAEAEALRAQGYVVIPPMQVA